MILDDYRPGTHADQLRRGRVSALAAAGIGSTYVDVTLDSLPGGAGLKDWVLENFPAVSRGRGLDLRGGLVVSKAMALVGRAFLMAGNSVRLLHLINLARTISDEEKAEELGRVQCLLIRDFETTHENPLRPYEIAAAEAYLRELHERGVSITVSRHQSQPRGWWSEEFEELLATRVHRFDEVGKSLTRIEVSE